MRVYDAGLAWMPWRGVGAFQMSPCRPVGDYVDRVMVIYLVPESAQFFFEVLRRIVLVTSSYEERLVRFSCTPVRTVLGLGALPVLRFTSPLSVCGELSTVTAFRHVCPSFLPVRLRLHGYQCI